MMSSTSNSSIHLFSSSLANYFHVGLAVKYFPMKTVPFLKHKLVFRPMTGLHPSRAAAEEIGKLDGVIEVTGGE